MLAACLAFAVVATSLVDFAAHLRVGLLDASLGSSWSHRLAAAILGASGLLALVTAVRSSAQRTWWCVASLALMALFIVEISRLHVEVDRVSHGKLVYLPLLAALVASLLRLTRCSDQRTLMWTGLAALTASYAVHLLGWDVVQRLGFRHGSWPDRIKVSIKEATGLAGWRSEQTTSE